MVEHIEAGNLESAFYKNASGDSDDQPGVGIFKGDDVSCSSPSLYHQDTNDVS